MERILSSDEKIRRAEEIYYRKKIQATNKKSARVNVGIKKDIRNIKKNVTPDYCLYFNICNFLYDTKYKLYIF